MREGKEREKERTCRIRLCLGNTWAMMKTGMEEMTMPLSSGERMMRTGRSVASPQTPEKKSKNAEMTSLRALTSRSSMATT